jgi:quercetin dioxygenase-like cupin family protein
MSFHNVAERAWTELVPGVRLRTFWGEQMMVCHVQLDAGAVVPPHSHPHEQGGTVLTGEIAFMVDGVETVARPGDSYIIPGGVPHSAVAHTACTLFEIFSPVRLEYQFP